MARGARPFYRRKRRVEIPMEISDIVGKSLGDVPDTVDGPAKSQSPVENDGKHPMILFGFQASVG